jgi:periplasmic divalent cation tolerance protein
MATPLLRAILPTMNSAAKFALVLVTAPELKVARRLAREALRARLIACANLIPKIESHYRWQGKIERSPEVLLLLKTTRPHVAALQQLILAKHPYDTPEFLVVNLSKGSKRYLQLLCDSVK